MTTLTASESATLERAADAPMLTQVEQWAAVNSGTGNLAGLKTVAGLLADAFAALPGTVRLVAPDPVESVDAAGTVRTPSAATISICASGPRRRCNCCSPAIWTRCSPPTMRSRLCNG